MLRALLWLPLAMPLAGWCAQNFAIEATSQGSIVTVHAQARIHARYALIWQTLTAYEELPRFIPDMTYSKILERHGSSVIVEQKGVTAVLMFSYPVEVTVESVEQPPDTLRLHVLKGNLKQLDGAYTLEKIPGSDDDYHLDWRGVIEPGFAVPAFITRPLLRSTVEKQFLGMVGEIERREAAAVAAEASK
jgi:ribosome-associated toxin RatA of RatAB toxin-antitoxin module